MWLRKLAKRGPGVLATLPKILRYITVPIESLRAGECVLARDENDPDGELVLRQVEERFERTAYRLTVLTLHDATGREQTIKTTAEHPVYKVGEGWVASGELKAGDTIGQADGRTSVVTRVGREEHRDGIRVYNLRVAECHTYFVRAEGSDAEPVRVNNADGSYTNSHASGKTYSGKDDITRANRSVAAKAKLYKDPLVGQDWTPAASEAHASVQEAIRLRQYGGPGGNADNKINSPGESILCALGV